MGRSPPAGDNDLGVVTNLLIDNLAAACREHLLAEKWLVAPSLRVAHQWLDRVTRAGGPVINVRAKTTRSLALEVLAPALTDGTLRVASSADRRLVVAEAWDHTMAGDGYLGRTERSPRLLLLAEQAILDLRLAGLGPAQLDPRHFEQDRKGRELRELLAAYEKALIRRGLIDHADTMRLAAAELRERPPAAADVVMLVPDDLRLTPIEQRLLETLAGTTVALVVDEPVGPDDDAGSSCDLGHLGWIQRPDAAPPPSGDGSVRIVHAVGEVNEVRAALRACLARKIPLDEIELIYTATEPYAPLLFETAQRLFGVDTSSELAVPVTFADGVPARLTRPGRLLTAWLSWIEDGFPQSTLLRMLQAGLLRCPGHERPANLIRSLRGVRIGFDRSRYLPRLREHVDGLDRRRRREHEAGRHKDLDRRLRGARALLRLCETLMEVSPPRETPPDRVVTAAAALLRDHGRIASALDGLALQRLGQEIDAMADALAAADTLWVAGFDAWEWLAELPDRLGVGGSGPRPGHLHAASIRSGGHTGRPHTVILGLDDGRFPSSGRQDPLVLDGERRRLSTALPTSATRLHEQLEEFARLVCRLRGSLTLGFSGRDIADGSEMFPSPVVLSAYRIVSGDRSGDHTALREWLGPPASFAPQEIESCLDAAEWWQCHGADDSVGNLPGLVETTFEHLRHGSEATGARASDRFTIWDGRVEEPAPGLDPRHDDGPVLSATSSLATLGRCPLAYFQHYVLKIRPPEDVDVDPRQWLDGRDFGTLLHEVLYEFVSTLVGDGTWPPQPERDHPRIAAIVTEKAAAQRREVPPPSEEAFTRQHRQLGRAAEIFVNEQARETNGRPIYLEATIGLPSEKRSTDIDAPDPVVLDLGGGVTIRARARVDRIDRLDEASGGLRFTIIDYKSGSYTKSWDPPDMFAKGRLLQHALYMALAESVLRARFGAEAGVDRFTFLFPGVRTHGRPVWYPRSIVEEGLTMIERLCRLPAAGAFLATDEVEDCTFCDYQPSCRAVYGNLKDLCAASGRKLANRDNTSLLPLVELRLDP